MQPRHHYYSGSIMRIFLMIATLLFSSAGWADIASDDRPEAIPGLVYWDTEAGRVLRARIAADADYWQLVSNFAVQQTQSYCGVASAITVLNSMPIDKPVDAVYAPYAYFTQKNFFVPEVEKIVSAKTVLAQGITREEMTEALAQFGVGTRTIAGDALTDDNLRVLLKTALGDDGHFVLANYYRGIFGQVGGGHWSALGAYDAQTDRVLILDVAKYKYPPVWVRLSALRQALATLDTTSNKSRGLVLVTR